MDAFLILVVLVVGIVGITGATVFACEYLVRNKGFPGHHRVVRAATQEVAAAIVSANQTVHHNGIEDLLPNRIQPWTRAEREAFGIDDTEKFIRETDRIIKEHEWSLLAPTTHRIEDLLYKHGVLRQDQPDSDSTRR